MNLKGLGECQVIKTHDDGDLTVSCEGVKYVVTKEGEVFREAGACLPESAKTYAFVLIENERHRLKGQLEQVRRSNSPYSRDAMEALGHAMNELGRLEKLVDSWCSEQ